MTKDTPWGQVVDDTASVEVVEVVAPADGAISLLVLPDIGLPEAGLAVLHVPLVVAHGHGSVVGIVAPVGEAVMDGSVPCPACQCGDAGNPGDEGKGGDDLPPHPDKQATLSCRSESSNKSLVVLCS